MLISGLHARVCVRLRNSPRSLPIKGELHSALKLIRGDPERRGCFVWKLPLLF